MKASLILICAGALALTAGLLSGCGESQLAPNDPRYETLTVAYGDPGPSAGPCDDALPQIDGAASDLEWSSAEPLFVRMSGADGNGGADFYLEVRAIWTDEGKLGGTGTNRIYFLVRYPDDDVNNQPDLLAYIQPRQPGELCDPIVIGSKTYCSSPPPRIRGVEIPPTEYDTLLVQDATWTRINDGGREDQVMLLLTEVGSQTDQSNLIDADGYLLGHIGDQSHPGLQIPGPAPASGIDVWVWRAGRTNLHPIYQFPIWDSLDPNNNLPNPQYSTFTQKSGFCEDLWIDPGGVLRDDAGIKPFYANFGGVNPKNGAPHLDPATGLPLTTAPIFVPQPPPAGRDPTDVELAAQNGGIPKDLGLWGLEAKQFLFTDTLATTRIGARPPKWGTRLLPGEFDAVSGWAMTVPDANLQNGDPNTVPIHSNRDVRARGAYEMSADKGYGVRVVEIMRDLDTRNADDLVIRPGDPGEFRMVIGVLDASGNVGSGSTEIWLKFEAPHPRGGLVKRC